jgi:ubiquinone/menaquinone biosynthesis C-methylase UbiE
MRRVVTQELLDEDIGSPEEVATSLAELRNVNRLLGGTATTTALLRRACSRAHLSEAAVLDVGSGSGDTALGAAKRLERQRIDLRVTLLDRRPTHLPQKSEIHLVGKVVGDALRLPFADASFDFVTCSLFMHHLEPAQVTAFVRETLRVTRHAVLINDLVRSPIHLTLARIGLLTVSHMSRYDGIASIRRAYTPSEIKSMLSDQGAALEVSRHYFYRMGITVWK